MTIIEAILLGVVQGLSEFLPISSSGHLALGQALLGIRSGDVTFEVIAHFGTALAVLTVLRERVTGLVTGVFQGDPAARTTTAQILVGTIPAGAIGVLFEDPLSEAFGNPVGVSVLLIVTGLILYSSRWAVRRAEDPAARDGAEGARDRIGWVDAVLIGCAQALAILPGISRSGTTITTGLWRGVNGREAATFSFLLALPVIFGATFLKLKDLLEAEPGDAAILVLLAGFVAAYASGVFAIRLLLRVLDGGRLDRFAYYCVVVGACGLIYFR